MSAQTHSPGTGAGPVVFWDIDGSLLDTSMERLFLRFLFRNRYVHPYRLPVNLLLLALTTFPPLWYRLKALYIRNISEENMAEWANTCFRKDILPRLRPGAYETVTKLKERGVRQVLLSGTLFPLASALGVYLGIADIIAAYPEIRSGRYTGRLRAPHPHGLYKKMYADDWLSSHGFSWSDATAIANHYDDRHLLQASAKPIAAFPDAKLERVAGKNDWTIMNSFIDVPEIILPQ